MSTSSSASLLSASMNSISYNKRQIATVEKASTPRYWLMDYDPYSDTLNIGQVYSSPSGVPSTSLSTPQNRSFFLVPYIAL